MGPFRRLRGEGDEGMAIVLVLGTMTILTIFLLGTLAFAIQNAKPARNDQDAKTALAAAEAGMDEYISRLNADSTYWLRGNVDSGNPAFSSGGQVIPGTSGAGAKFTYRLLSSAADVDTTGQIRLQVTGSSSAGPGNPVVSRTVTGTLKPSGFLDYVYLSDYEVIDPDLNGTSASCATYYYNSRSSSCTNIQWAAVDTVNGPFHSNDQIQVNGAAKFLSPKTETSWPATQTMAVGSKTWWGTQSAPMPSGTPAGYAPKYAAPIQLPAGNTTLATRTTPGADGLQTGPGCYYRGATRIVFQGATMRVLSPSTTSLLTPSRCLDVGNRANEQIKTIPPVIYVDGVTVCGTGTGYSTSGGRSGVGYPMTGSTTATTEAYTAPGSSTAFHSNNSAGGISTNYYCNRGVAYVSGTVDAQVTVGALDDIVVTGDLTLSDGGAGTDVVGLIAGNDVWVYHPINSSGNNLLSSPVNDIYAAVLALRHSFVAQNWSEGSPVGTLNVTGAIAQKFRGAVNTGSGASLSTGYGKNYVYDDRFAYLQPPYFLMPDASPWYVASITDK